MKVAYLIGSLHRGGTETLMLDIFRNAEKVSYDMIGIHRKGGVYRDDFYATVPQMVQLAPKRFGLLRYLFRLRKLLKQEQVDVIHAQQPLDTVYGYIATIGTGKMVMQTFHGFHSMDGTVGLLTRLSIQMSDKLCFVSKYEKEWYQRQMQIADEKCHVIYNCVDFSKIDSAEPSIEFANQPPRIRLAMVGNFVSGRSQNVIAKSIHLLRNRGVHNFEFYFIGRRVAEQASYYDECIRYSEKNGLNNIHFLGGRGDVPSLLKTMDAFVYSTAHDTFGIAVVEAMATGLPVVVNDWPVMKEVCGDEVAYFKTKDIEDCADAIEKLLAELPQRKEAAKKYASVVRNRYSMEMYLSRLCAVYNV